MQITKKNTDNHYFCQKYGCARFTTCCRSWSHRVCAQRGPQSRGTPSAADRSACQWQCSPRDQHPRGNSWPLTMFLTATIKRSASPRSAANNWPHSKTLNSLSGGGHAKQLMTYTACARYFVPAPVIKHVTLRPSVTFKAVAPVINFVAPAPTVTDTSPAPMSGYVKPAPAVIYTASAQVVPQELGHQRTVSPLNIEIVERIKVVSRRESSNISFLVTFRNKLCSACTSACMGQQYFLGAGRSITGSGLLAKPFDADAARKDPTRTWGVTNCGFQHDVVYACCCKLLHSDHVNPSSKSHACLAAVDKVRDFMNNASGDYSWNKESTEKGELVSAFCVLISEGGCFSLWAECSARVASSFTVVHVGQESCDPRLVPLVCFLCLKTWVSLTPVNYYYLYNRTSVKLCAHVWSFLFSVTCVVVVQR